MYTHGKLSSGEGRLVLVAGVIEGGLLVVGLVERGLAEHGLGGAFGFFWATGNALPFPECQPFKGSLQLRGLGILQKMLKLLPGNDQ